VLRFSFIAQTLGELTRAVLAHRAKRTATHCTIMRARGELFAPSGVSPRDVEKIDVFAPCG